MKCHDEAIKFAFGDIEHESSLTSWTKYASKCAILAPTNEVVNKVNASCLEKLPGDSVLLPSISSTVDNNDAVNYPTEYIESLEAPGIPPHNLKLKKGAVVILLRNLNIEGGLCNGTRLIIDEIINNRIIKAIIASGEHQGDIVLIPRIQSKPPDYTPYGFEWKRLQFPLRLAFSMTINKAQGQTLKHVSVWLETQSRKVEKYLCHINHK